MLSCTHKQKTSSIQNGIKIYSYNDISGKFNFSREIKNDNKKIITRTLLAVSEGGNSKVLEKSITVTQIGTVKLKSGRIPVSRPLASDFTVWLEGKKYQSSMRLNEKEKNLVVDLESPDPKWSGVSKYSFPKGNYFCFYSQIPDCLHQNSLLERALEKKNKKFPFIIVWDNFPFIQEQLNGVGQKPFSNGFLKFEELDKKTLKYSVEVDGQSVLYHFSRSFDLMRILWISQGITIVPPEEEINAEVE